MTWGNQKYRQPDRRNLSVSDKVRSYATRVRHRPNTKKLNVFERKNTTSSNTFSRFYKSKYGPFVLVVIVAVLWGLVFG